MLGKLPLATFDLSPEVLAAVRDGNMLFAIDWPYESNKVGMEFFNKLSLNDADKHKLAHGNAELVHWVSELYGLHTMDAYQLCSQVAQVPVANVVDANYSVVV